MCSLAREITCLIDENYVGDLIFYAEIMLPSMGYRLKIFFNVLV